MPMYDTDTIFAAGIKPNKGILKYGNSIDQNGNPVVPNLLKYNLDYDSLYSIMKQQNKIETIERYMWLNVPPGLTADLILRWFKKKNCLQ